MELSNSGNVGNNNVIPLRAHHICCAPLFFEGPPEDRGTVFNQIGDKIKNMFLSSSDSKVMVIEGADEICRECLFYDDGVCISPHGGEDAVRKWDAILLNELGVTLNTCMTSGQWRSTADRMAAIIIMMGMGPQKYRRNLRMGLTLSSSISL